MRKFSLFALVLVMALMFASLVQASSSFVSNSEPNVQVSTGANTILEVWVMGWSVTTTAGTCRLVNTITATEASTVADTDAKVLDKVTFVPNTLSSVLAWVPVCIFSSTLYNGNKVYGIYAATGIQIDSKGNTPSVLVIYKAGQ